MGERTTHWDAVYTSKAEGEVSWFEARPEASLALLAQAGLEPRHAIVDIGGGASRLVDALVARGQRHVTVLDLSRAALDVARRRLPDDTAVDWVAEDVTQWAPVRPYDAWHDRAAFHFLTEAEDQARYRQVLEAALVPGGIAVIGTFAPDGPEKCSGLPVARHDAASLSSVLGAGFELVGTQRHDHSTPWGSVQHFQFSTFRRRGV